jgi:hypothetical protein
MHMQCMGACPLYVGHVSAPVYEAEHVAEGYLLHARLQHHLHTRTHIGSRSSIGVRTHVSVSAAGTTVSYLTLLRMY